MISTLEHVAVTFLGWIHSKILRVGYFWPSLIKYCIEAVKKCHPCQIFSRKMQAHPAPMFHVIVVGPFTKWGIDFTTCHPTSARGNHYIIVAVDYFTKWVEAMPTFSNDGEMTHSSFSTKSFLGSVYRKRLSLTMEVTFKIR
jgi:hypothetical protein